MQLFLCFLFCVPVCVCVWGGGGGVKIISLFFLMGGGGGGAEEWQYILMCISMNKYNLVGLGRKIKAAWPGTEELSTTTRRTKEGTVVGLLLLLLSGYTGFFP